MMTPSREPHDSLANVEDMGFFYSSGPGGGEQKFGAS
jgi:hypothetical protein